MRASAGMGALHWAAAAGDEACLMFLRERAMDVDELSWAGLSPLAYAARGGHAGAVRLLLADADPNVGARPVRLNRRASDSAPDTAAMHVFSAEALAVRWRDGQMRGHPLVNTVLTSEHGAPACAVSRQSGAWPPSSKCNADC